VNSDIFNNMTKYDDFFDDSKMSELDLTDLLMSNSLRPNPHLIDCYGRLQAVRLDREGGR